MDIGEIVREMGKLSLEEAARRLGLDLDTASKEERDRIAALATDLLNEAGGGSA